MIYSSAALKAAMTPNAARAKPALAAIQSFYKKRAKTKVPIVGRTGPGAGAPSRGGGDRVTIQPYPGPNAPSTYGNLGQFRLNLFR